MSTDYTVAFLALKKCWGVFWGQRKCGEQRLEVRVKSSFTVVNLYDIWSKYHRNVTLQT